MSAGMSACVFEGVIIYSGLNSPPPQSPGSFGSPILILFQLYSTAWDVLRA